MPVTYIEARVSQQAALRFFNRRRLANAWGLWPLPKATAENAATKTLPFTERIWMPFYRIDMAVRSHRGPGAISTSVEAWSGAFAIFQMHQDLLEGHLQEPHFPPGLTQEEAGAIARPELLRTIMRRRGQRGKPVIEDITEIAVFYYPFWVCYYRKGHRLDIHLQDALSGERGGNRNKLGILNAFTAAKAKPATP